MFRSVRLVAAPGRRLPSVTVSCCLWQSCEVRTSDVAAAASDIDDGDVVQDVLELLELLVSLEREDRLVPLDCRG